MVMMLVGGNGSVGYGGLYENNSGGGGAGGYGVGFSANLWYMIYGFKCMCTQPTLLIGSYPGIFNWIHRIHRRSVQPIFLQTNAWFCKIRYIVPVHDLSVMTTATSKNASGIYQQASEG